MSQNKAVVFITGCGHGFGNLMAKTFSKNCQVIASSHCLTDALKKESQSFGYESIQCDVTRIDDIKSARDYIHQKYGKLDILINNAGVAIGNRSFEDSSNRNIRHMFEVNYFGLMNVTRALLPLLRLSSYPKKAKIINISSIAGFATLPFGINYSATKHAVEAFTKALHYELMPFDIQCISIQPGFFKTNYHYFSEFLEKDSTSSSYYKQVYEKFSKLFQSTRFGDPNTVGTKVFQISQKRYPKKSYKVGFDAHLFGFIPKLLAFNMVRIFKLKKSNSTRLNWDQECKAFDSHLDLQYQSNYQKTARFNERFKQTFLKSV